MASQKRSTARADKPSDTTTIRVDRDTHARLMKLSEETRLAIVDIVRQSVAAFEHNHFAERIVAQLEAMRNDPDEWQSYVEECEMFGGYGRGTIDLDD